MAGGGGPGGARAISAGHRIGAGDGAAAQQRSRVVITLRELVGLPHLDLEVLAGRAGLAAPVRWAHVAEVEDPTPWLQGGELLIATGALLPAGAARQVAYA